MKITAISDTHRSHLDYTDIIESVGGDLLIHAGDSDCYDKQTTLTFLNWLKKVSQPFSHGALVTFGNHDSFIQDNLDEVREYFEGSNVRVLINESVEIGGIKFWLSPYSLAHGPTWSAFTLPDSELGKIWAQIPDDVQVLVTHTPAYGHLDNHHGSRSLAQRIEQLPNLKLHCCGHIHETHGHEYADGIHRINAASIGNMIYGPWLPIWLEIKEDGTVEVQPPGEMDVT